MSAQQPSVPQPITRPGVLDDGEADPVSPRLGAGSYWPMLMRAALAAGGVHLAFSAIFFSLGAPLMGWANLGSVALYVLAYGLLKRRRYGWVLALVWTEILVHALVATALLGWDSGFHYYVLVMVPMVFVSPERSLRIKSLLGLALVAFYIGLDVYARRQGAWTPIAPAALDAVRHFNIVATLVLLAYLANFYLGAVRRVERRLQNLATTDALTGLANRRRVMQMAEQQLGRRRRDGTPLSFILGDVDHFKAVNDRHGHAVGDRVLVKVGQAMKSATREVDMVSRWGGEEFLVVLPETGRDEALQVAERVRAAVGQAGVTRGGQVLRVTLTLGVSSLRDGETLQEAIARADAAMYRGKQAGRDRCVLEDAAVAGAVPASGTAQG